MTHRRLSALAALVGACLAFGLLAAPASSASPSIAHASYAAPASRVESAQTAAQKTFRFTGIKVTARNFTGKLTVRKTKRPVKRKAVFVEYWYYKGDEPRQGRKKVTTNRQGVFKVRLAPRSQSAHVVYFPNRKKKSNYVDAFVCRGQDGTWLKQSDCQGG